MAAPQSTAGGSPGNLSLKRSRRLEALERRRSAVHEAGHSVIARWLGLYVRDCWIWRTGQPPDGDSRSWAGETGLNGGSASDRRLTAVAVAGVVAEAAWDGSEELEEYLLGMSPRDLAMAAGKPHHGRVLKAAVEVFELLERGGHLWSELVREARRLIIEERS